MFNHRKTSPQEKLRVQVKRRYELRAGDALQELDRVPESSVADRTRVQSAILKLTDNSFVNLKRWVEVALYDYRDVLGPAENPSPSTKIEVQAFNDFSLDSKTLRESSFEELNVTVKCPGDA